MYIGVCVVLFKVSSHVAYLWMRCGVHLPAYEQAVSIAENLRWQYVSKNVLNEFRRVVDLQVIAMLCFP